jgi:hypothetical protein
MLAPARPEGAAPTAIAAPTMAAATSRGVTATPPVEAAPAGAVAMVAAEATAPVGAAAMAAVEAASADSAAAATTSAASVFLLRLPSGWPCLRGIGSVAAGSFALFLLPKGRHACPARRVLQPQLHQRIRSTTLRKGR